MNFFGMDPAVSFGLVLIFGLVVFTLVAKPLRRSRKASGDVRAVLKFQQQREWLEADFQKLAARSGKPRGVTWQDIQWTSTTRFARDTQTGQLTAFVGVNISFEAEEGGDMEDVEAVGLLREASALFHYDEERWGTGGRALFNMQPDDALERFASQFTPIELPVELQNS